ncbi:hypothetical protein [Enemella sp. A6]
MNLGFVFLEAYGPHPLVFGIIALIALLVALAFVRGIGKGRPHS